MNTIWNHWFWITLGLCAQVLGEDGYQAVGESPVSLPAGARGGKILSIPANGGPPFRPPPPRASFLRPAPPRVVVRPAGPPRVEVRPAGPPRLSSSVSVSKSVSKVSVKRGQVSMAEPGLKSLADISEIYVDRGIGNHVDRRIGNHVDRRIGTHVDRNIGKPVDRMVGEHVNDVGHKVGNHVEPSPRPQARRIDPQFISYNLVYREPMKTTPKPPATAGLLETIIAKLKSLARATSSGIRFSSLLTGDDSMPAGPIHRPPPSAVRPAGPEGVPRRDNVLVRIDDLGVMGGVEDEEMFREEEGEGAQEEIRGEEEGTAEEIITHPEGVEDADDLLDSLELIQTHGNEVDEAHSRSSEARGRSLPLHVLDEIEMASMEESKEAEEDDLIFIQEIGSDQWEEEAGSINEEDFNEFTGNGLDPVSSSYKIEMERLGTANISAIVGVILGIIIFIIISIVLIFLAVGRGRRRVKKAGPAEDQISQSSYMTYSTTVSDHSVHYGPNWDKEIVDDLCSLDNDSFLNSLEAVATTDYWVDCKY